MAGGEEHQLIHGLRDQRAWPADEPGPIGFVETHISRIFLGRDHVLKLKRPVHYSFVDYSTLEKRRQACLDEVRLNRLLTDDIYLGVVPVVRDGERLRIGREGEAGEVVEWGTWMRRIDDSQMLDDILQRGEHPDGLSERLADRLVPFHRNRPPAGRDDPGATLATLMAVVTENLDEVQSFAGDPLPPEALATIDRAMRGFARERHEDMQARVDDGWVREGHGDLRCEHVVVPLEGPVQVFDCVEFNRDLRVADVASDLGFLLMDLFRLGAPVEDIHELLRRYRTEGLALPVALLRFFWIHRALVRAKVHCLRLADLRPDQRLAVTRKAIDYIHVAYRQAVTTKPAMIAMTGLSGTGKSTIARAISRATGALFLDTDIIRKDAAWLGGDLAKARGEDIYTPEWTRRTYDRMIGAGIETVRGGNAAILDGTFLDRALRDRAAAAARALRVPFVMVEVTCDEDEVMRRLRQRMRDPRQISDAGVEIHLRQRERLLREPPGVPAGTVYLMVDASPEVVSLDPVLRVLQDAGVVVPGIREDGPLV